MFQPNEIIVKQNEINKNIFFIVDGIVEVLFEYVDYEFFIPETVSSFYGVNADYKKSVWKYKKRQNKYRSDRIKQRGIIVWFTSFYRIC